MISHEAAAHWMERCLSLAANADNATSPNPRVGCVILSPEGKLLGEGWHRRVGGLHAEAEAINQVRSQQGAQALQGSTLVVNLEPCNHQGRTPPCSHSIIDSGVAQVVIGMKDPNPVAAGGIDWLRSANISVMTDVLKSRCYRFNEAFAHWQTRQIPFVTLKLAQTLDGCIATAKGESQWITGKVARKCVHVWRAENDAVLIGSGTARTDDPSLTVRHVSGTQPWRIILDGQAELPSTLKVFTDEWASKTVAIVANRPTSQYCDQLSDKGVRLIIAPSRSNRVILSELIRLLGTQMQIQSLLVEAGPRLASTLIQQDLIDRLRLLIAPKLIGDGLHAFGDLGVKQLRNCFIFNEYSWESIGEDQLFTGHKHPVPA
ncbi:MAG: bifunctional diaminohydroxyphosphoribosylaminopyrimidine deaminase/5-amino-6-(5-phosphoribosylamino)uracil reductase RibD [Bacteroidetes bacterium]|nr:bifunctional diaminohydroxyphosphoribosylaminopyrimidine deaminase/5-amino-6-(5-phosphoribosylamino)uracil reductase RibD [Bacteroidota bacterium]